MPSIGYLFGRIRSMNTKNMRLAAKRIAGEARRPALFVLADMAWCGFRYGAGYMDYELFHFWEKSGSQRATYLTRGRNNEYVKALNDRGFWKLFEDKPLFLERFRDYCPREWLDIRSAGADELERFGTRLGEFIAKPPDASHGDGVEKISASAVDDWPALHARLTQSGSALCEEVVRQHDDVNAICPGSVNTVRFVTLVKDGTPHIVATYLRVGGGKRPVDNFNGGGMVTVVDRETGVILYPAVAKAGVVYEEHPVTGKHFAGTRLPMWEECREFVLRAAVEVPEVKYVGWDVAITPDGPTFVEGNQYPGHDIYGLEPHSPDGRGVLPDWEAVYTLKELKRIQKAKK